ncbi:MAG: maturation protein [Sanya fiers-like virus 8]|nr:MAG: maturation protein [Sanya fiers-like virus 8]
MVYHLPVTKCNIGRTAMQNRSVSDLTGVWATTSFNASTGALTSTTASNRHRLDRYLNVLVDTNTGNLEEYHAFSFEKYDHYWMTANYSNYSLTRQKYGYSYESSTGVSGNSALPSGVSQTIDFSSIAYNKALDELYENLRGSLDLSIDLLEHESTRRMVTPLVKVCHGFVSFVNEVRRIRRNPKRAVDDVSNLWLQYTYGVSPLMSSAYSFVDAFRSSQRGLVTVRGFGSEKSSRTVTSGTGIQRMVSAIRDTQRCEFRMELDIDSDALSNLANLSSLNPASIVWELVPYSFVVDWVVDIGGYLRSVESALIYRRNFRRGYVTETSRRMVNSSWDNKVNTGTNLLTQTGYGSCKGSKKRRQILSGPPMPHLPRPKVDLGWRRLLSAAALSQQALKRL